MQPIPRYNVLGTGISAVDLTTARAAILAARAAGRGGYVSTADVRTVNLAANDPVFRSILNASLLTTPDGMPLVWLGRLLGHRSVSRVYGPDLMLDLCAATAGTGQTHSFVGGAPGVAETLSRRLQERFPGLQVVGTISPPFRPLTADEEAALIAQMANSRPDFLWVGLGLPERERFMARLAPKLGSTIMIGGAWPSICSPDGCARRRDGYSAANSNGCSCSPLNRRRRHPYRNGIGICCSGPDESVYFAFSAVPRFTLKRAWPAATHRVSPD
jgi:N-acetylglucosaminyldiphosphoundecaprenol N-acetyl-beta-D-mannosaminyltransferase